MCYLLCNAAGQHKYGLHKPVALFIIVPVNLLYAIVQQASVTQRLAWTGSRRNLLNGHFL